MLPRDLIPALAVVVCVILGGLWPADSTPVTPSDGPQFLEWCRETREC